ncbi:MAG: DUF481 domain-containing protein [Gemmatimonadota bacterium]|nr:DUF481 domain-containing protein [Gemmatimonadota bacterium]
MIASIPTPRGARSLCLAAVLSLAPGAAAPTEGQIINTLRRWSDAEPGWSGDVEGTLALAEGNTEYLELTGGANVQLVAERHRLRGLGSGSLRRASGEKIAESILAHVRHNYSLTALVSTLVFVQYQADPFRRLARRTLLGAGARLDVVRRERWEAALGLSYMYEGEEITDDPDRGIEREGRGSFFLSAIGDLTETLRVDVSTFYQPLFSDFADARAYTAASLRLDIVGELDLIVRFDLTHDSRPPEDVEPTDIRLSTGLVFDF